MKSKLFYLSSLVFLQSCVSYPTTTNYPTRNTIPTRNTASNTESEYYEVLKTYKSETAAVLTDLLNDPSPTDTKTSLLVENLSRCNMVLTVSGNNYFKKIPIAPSKMAAVMLPKNQNYRLSSIICNSTYQSTKYITKSTSLKLSN